MVAPRRKPWPSREEEKVKTPRRWRLQEEDQEPQEKRTRWRPQGGGDHKLLDDDPKKMSRRRGASRTENLEDPNFFLNCLLPSASAKMRKMGIPTYVIFPTQKLYSIHTSLSFSQTWAFRWSFHLSISLGRDSVQLEGGPLNQPQHFLQQVHLPPGYN